MSDAYDDIEEKKVIAEKERKKLRKMVKSFGITEEKMLREIRKMRG